MAFEKILRKVIGAANKIKPYVDSVVDPTLVVGAANAGMLYGLFKIGDSDLNDPAKVLAIGAGALADYFANKKIVFPLAKKIREIDLRKAGAGLEARIGSWFKTGVLAITIVATVPYVAKNVKHILYEAIRPNAEQLIYKGVDVSNVKLAEKESEIGRIQRTERWKYLTDKYEKMYGMPQYTLYKLIMEESYGDPTCINENDGGAGLIHTQPGKAQELGLKVYQNCNAIISKEHAEALAKLIKRVKYNLDSLSAYDDRFNNEKLISEIAKELKKNYEFFGDWDAAVAAINTGRNGVYNKNSEFTKKAKKYLGRVNRWEEIRKNKKIMAEAAKDFNRRNYEKGLTFDGYVGWFKNNNGKNRKK